MFTLTSQYRSSDPPAVSVFHLVIFYPIIFTRLTYIFSHIVKISVSLVIISLGQCSETQLQVGTNLNYVCIKDLELLYNIAMEQKILNVAKMIN